VRLFVALEIPVAVREQLAALMKGLAARETCSPRNKARWVRAENFHVTLKFLGETDPAKLDAIVAALPAVHSEQPMGLRFRGLGFFPNEKHPRVLWVGIEAPPSLAVLAADIDTHVAKLGFEREKRAFTPHLTLARFEPPGISPELHAAVKENTAREFGALQTGQFHLIQSKLKPSGAEYTTLQSFPFAAEN
jgi:RNA 2',3'-cyclic 3'-phosphodiesterase